MKIFIFILFTVISVNVNAGLYTDFGFGYVQSMPGESDIILELNGNIIVHANEKANVEIESPFTMIRVGYRWDVSNYHLEYHRFGLLNDNTESISSARVYRRFELKNGLYTDLGIGYVIDLPNETETEIEHDEYDNTYQMTQTATINLDSPFPMIRLGFKWKSTNIQLEVEQIGNIFDKDESIFTINMSKRWEFDI